MSNVLFGWPIYGDSSVSYGPTFSGGGWDALLPVTNLQDRNLAVVARTRSAAMADTRARLDLKTDRQVQLLSFPKHTVSSAGKVRFLGVPSSMLFDYEAGQDIAAAGGTFSRTPTATARAATYVDSLGMLRFAGENRCLRSEAFDNAIWSKSSVTVSADSITAPDGNTTADTLTASGSNGTVLQSVTTTAVTWTFSVWLKRKTGSGAVSIQVDGSTYVAQSVTTDWQRFSVPQTGTAGATSIGIKIAVSGDAVYAWGAQAEIGSSAGPYLPTTSAMVGAPRDSHYPTIGGSRTLLLEGARTNLCLQSENFGTTWSAIGSPTRLAAALACGVLTLEEIGDDSDVALEGYSQAVTFTGNAVKAISVFVRISTSGASVIRLRDTTASADRLLAQVTWSGTTPVVTMTTGTAISTQGPFLDSTGGAYVYRLLFATTSVTAANTNSLQIYPASGSGLAVPDTGKVFVGGVQVEDALVPSSYIPTTTATVARGAELLSFSYSAVPQAATLDVKYSDLNDASGSAKGVVSIGGATKPYGQLSSTSAHAGWEVTNASTGVSKAAAAAITYGDTVELRAPIMSDGSVLLGQSLNGGAEAATSASGSLTLAGAWNATTIWIGSLDGSGTWPGYGAFQYVRIVAGVQTLSYMQSIVYDSGWVATWPSGATAEDVNGINVAHVQVVPSTQTAFRYLGFQVDDTQNSAGYLDFGRLIVAGGYTPTINAAYPIRITILDQTTRTDTDAGQYYNVKPVRRVLEFTLDDIEETEMLANVWRRERQLGLSGQVMVILNPAESTSTLFERAFLAVLDNLQQIENANLSRHNAPFRFREEL